MTKQRQSNGATAPIKSLTVKVGGDTLSVEILCTGARTLIGRYAQPFGDGEGGILFWYEGKVTAGITASGDVSIYDRTKIDPKYPVYQVVSKTGKTTTHGGRGVVRKQLSITQLYRIGMNVMRGRLNRKFKPIADTFATED